MEEDLGQRTRRSLVWNTVLPIVFQGFRLAISIVIARTLAPKDFGIMSIASILIFYTNNLSNFGLATALVQRRAIDRLHIGSIFSFNLAVSLLLTLVTIAFSGIASRYFAIPELAKVLIALSPVFIITSFFMIPATLLRRDVNFKVLSSVNFLKGGVQSLTSLALALAGFGYWSLVIAVLVENLVGTIVIVLLGRWKPAICFSYRAFRELVNFSSWVFIMGQADLLNNYVDKFIVGKVIGPTMLGYYDKAFSFAVMPVESISDRIGGVMFATFSRAQDDRKQLENFFLKSLLTVSLLCFPIFAGLICTAPYFVTVLLGDKWQQMVLPLQIFCLAFIFNSLVSLIRPLNVATGRHKEQGMIRLFTLALMICLCLAWVHRGIEAVAMVILSIQFISFLLSGLLAKRALAIGIGALAARILPALSGTLVMSVAVKTGALYHFRELNAVNFISLVLIGAGVYITWILFVDFAHTRFLKEELRSRFHRFCQWIQKA